MATAKAAALATSQFGRRSGPGLPPQPSRARTRARCSNSVEIIELYDPLVNNEQMTPRMAPVLERAADGDAGLNERPGASEDVSFFLNEVPGL